MRFSVKQRRGIPALFLIMIIAGTIITGTFWLTETHLKPTIITIAEARATFIATQAINKVINEKVSATIDPQTLVFVKFDSKGKVVLIQPNTMEFNKLAADTTMQVQDALKAIKEEKIYIPLGQVIGSQLLASYGPKIAVTLLPIGTVNVKVVDRFEQAGINQTRHRVYLVATTQVRIVVPMVSKSVEVETQVPVAESVIVGEVPNTYVQMPFPLTQDR